MLTGTQWSGVERSYVWCSEARSFGNCSCVALITYIHVGIGCAQDDSGATFLAHMLLRGSFVAIYVIRGTAGTRIINLIFALISVYLRINYFFIVLGDVMDITSGARRQDPSAALRMTSYKSCRVTDTCN